MRFLLIVLILAAVGLAYTNPTTDDVRSQINAHAMAQLGPSTGGGNLPDVPAELRDLATDKLQTEIYIDRKDYYLFSIFKVTIGGNAVIGNTPEGVSHEGGQQLPGCIIGIAKQAIPYDKC